MNKPLRFDFFAKLAQPDMVESLRDYVSWQKKVRHALEHGQQIPDFPDSVLPRSINLDLTTACNFACTHCIDFDVLNTGIKYDYLRESLTYLIDKGLRSVILIGGGEPTIDPQFVPTVQFLKEQNVQVAVVTNGTRPERLLEIMPILTPGDWIRYSLDSGTNDTFIKMHRPKGKMRVLGAERPGQISLENICAWVSTISGANPAVPVNFSYIVTWPGAEQLNDGAQVDVVDNIDEIASAAQLAKASGFGEISVKAFLSREESGAEAMVAEAIAYRDKTLERITCAVKEAQSTVTDDTFKVVVSTNLAVLLDGSWQKYQKQPNMCHMIPFRQVLSPLGLFNCPAHRGAEKALITHKNAYGHQNWQHETVGRMQSAVVDFDAATECAATTCMYNPTNWLIEQIITGELDLDTEIARAPEIADNRFL